MICFNLCRFLRYSVQFLSECNLSYTKYFITPSIIYNKCYDYLEKKCIPAEYVKYVEITLNTCSRGQDRAQLTVQSLGAAVLVIPIAHFTKEMR